MRRVIYNIKIVRLFCFTILIGVYLSANSNSKNLPAPIPIDFGVNNGMRSDNTICESCNISYDADIMGAACCDEATQFNSDFTCEVLETAFLWNCSGCACTEDDDNWTTDFGCMDELACNYNSIVIWDDGMCNYTDGICQICIDGEVVDNDDDGDNVCNEQEILGCQDETACDYNPDATDSGECSHQLSYCEDTDGDGLGAGEPGEYCLEDVPVGWVSDCSDSEPACATNDTDECGICGGEGDVYGNYENCCEINVDDCGVCFGTNASFDECGVCFGDNSTCMDCDGVPNGDSEPDECGVCNGPGPIYECGCSGAPTENYDCDGNCIVEIDCNNECGGIALEDECGVCDGDGSSCISWMELNAEGGENQISLSWEPVESTRPSFMNRDGCEDDPDICIWNSWYYDFDNQEDCEANGGIWGSYLEYFGTSCSEMVNEIGCDASILYWMVSDLCPESCGICLEGCTDSSACNYDPDANVDNGTCWSANDGCGCEDGMGAEVDECGVCNGDGSTCSGSTVSLELQNVDLDSGLLDIYMINFEEVGDFQFELLGITITGASTPDGFFHDYIF